MNETENQEIEIDLLELLQEFKNNLGKIIAVTLLFAAAAALYIFALTAPKYSYTQLVDCRSLSDKDKISFINVLSEDVVDNKGHGKMWKEPKKCALTKVEFVKDRNAATNLLKFEFRNQPRFNQNRMPCLYNRSVNQNQRPSCKTARNQLWKGIF